MKVSDQLIDHLLEACDTATLNGELPIGALIIQTELLNDPTLPILSIATNATSLQSTPLAHAEMLAIKIASEKIQNERLNGYSILTTLEPCLMCSGAIIHARLDAVLYLSHSDKGPGMRWLLGNTMHTPNRCNHYPELIKLHKFSNFYRQKLNSHFKKKR